MKIRLLITLFSLTSVLSYSQVGINTITPQAQLDIVAGNTPSEKDGILIPRLDEYPTGVGTNQDGMLVFITGNGTPTKGFYYWDNVGSAWVPVSGAGGSDADWNINGTSTSPTSINDNIYTLGNVKIGLNNTTETSRFYVNSDLATTNSGIRNIMSGNDDTVISYGIYNQGSITDALRHAGFHNVIGGTTDNTLYGIENRMVATGSGPKTAIVNEFDLSAPQGSKLGVLNRFEGGDSFVTGVRTEAPGAWSVTGTLTGVENDLSAGGNGVRYGVRNLINGLGTGAKYGSFNNIGSTAGGTHYGVYSDVRKANSYAGFFIGRMSLGTDGVLNRYLMPAADGTAGQVMTTDGSGNVTFQDAAAGGGTLDDAYDFGGAGAGKNIIADTGALRVDGEDGFLVTGTFGSGDAIDTEITGTGTRMFFYPRKAAFRAGYSEDARWDDANIGDYSFAVNRRSLASGFGSISLGYDSEATGDYSFVAGNNSAASGDNSFAFGLNSYTNNSNHAVVFGNVANARDDYSWAIGSGVNSYGVHSFSKGEGVTSYSYGETVFGFYNTSYTANSTTAFDAADRLFVLGNGVGATPSNALIIYKDGRMNINDAYTITNTDGTNGQVLTTDGGGNVTFQDATGGGTLDDAYDFGGAGTGRTITADNGAVDIQGAGGLRVEGNILAASNIFHDGDTNTFMSFTPDRVQFDAGGRNYIDIQHANEEIAFNEDSTESDFRVESGTNQNMFFVDGSTNRIGIGTNTPGNPFHINMNTPFDLIHQNTGQDDIFLTGGGNNGINEVAASIAFGGTNNRSNSRRAAISSLQTGGDVDFTGLAFYVHGNAINQSPMTEGMRLSHEGFLGINNTNPSATLDVVGTMQFVDGNEANGYVLASDANGNATWTDPATLVGADTDWTTVGADIERQSGDVYVGNDATTDNDIYISDRIIDWDNAAFYLDPSTTSSVDEINFSDGGASDPSIRFNGDTNTGFFQTEANAISFGASGTEYLKFSPKGQIEFLNTGNSVYVGSQAGNADDYSDNQNVGIGNSALLQNTTGNSNLAAGYLALRSNLTGNSNVALGYGTLFDNTTGENNTAIGRSALGNNIDGDKNIAIGNAALFDNTNGEDNIALGHQALTDNTANRNIGIGFTAGSRITTGTENIAIGYRAQAAHTTGNNNVVIGDRSLDSMNSTTTNSNNVAIGNDSMTNLTEAENNVAIGHQALLGNGNGSPNFASQNVAIGAGAGQSNEGDGNIFIGYQAGQSAGVSSNKLFIDNSNTSSPLVYATFDTNEVGINWNSATALPNTLSVNGTASKSAAGDWLANSDRRLKKNIKTINSSSALDRITSLRGVTYEWNDTATGIDRPDGIQYGFIAQELMEVFPENVTQDGQGFYQTAYGTYDALYVQAFKELNNKIEALSEENEQLKKQLAKYESLEARLSALENGNKINPKETKVTAEK